MSKGTRTAGAAALLAAAVVVTAGGGVADAATSAGTRTTVRTASTSTTSTTTGWSSVRRAAPARTEVRDARGALLATFTDGSRTVAVTGPSRTFSEPSTTTATVTTTSWVRLLPAPFAGQVDTAWLSSALADRSADVLARAVDLTTGAPHDATYGPLVDGVLQEGSDWNDYLGVTAWYDGVADAPEAAQLGSLDCSGFVRLLFGRLGGVPMTLSPDGVRLPRRAVQIAASAPGTVTARDTGARVTDLSTLQAGDLVLFDASTDDGTAIDHVGVYLGRDSAGHPRFVSSRKGANGPTMGDVKGASRLDGTGLYASALRELRRL